MAHHCHLATHPCQCWHMDVKSFYVPNMFYFLQKVHLLAFLFCQHFLIFNCTWIVQHGRYAYSTEWMEFFILLMYRHAKVQTSKHNETQNDLVASYKSTTDPKTHSHSVQLQQLPHGTGAARLLTASLAVRVSAASIHFTSAGVQSWCRRTQHWVPQVKLSTPKSHLSIPTTTTAFPRLVWSSRMLITATALTPLQICNNDNDNLTITCGLENVDQCLHFLSHMLSLNCHLLTCITCYYYRKYPFQNPSQICQDSPLWTTDNSAKVWRTRFFPCWA